ncbi:MAG: hypothetical protein Q7R49_02195 [Candidatus Daviesbacteria bacterium]|nr:hypothetical protein [Candidatus Daviesbacteria bacterium]
MTATAHALIGGAIAAAISDPAIGLPLATLSHPIADMIPHWDFGLGWRKKTKFTLILEGSADLLLGVVASYLIFGGKAETWYLFTAIFLAEVWDLMQVPYWILNWKFPPFSTFYNFQHLINSKATLPWGILTQAATVGGLVLILRTIH